MLFIVTVLMIVKRWGWCFPQLVRTYRFHAGISLGDALHKSAHQPEVVTATRPKRLLFFRRTFILTTSQNIYI